MQKQVITVIGRASVAAFLAACAMSYAGTLPAVPDSIAVPATQPLLLGTRASGVQIYDCRPGKDDPYRFEWVFRAPEADLFDAAGTRVGKHYAGPTWEADDGSKVVGETKAHDDGPDINAIPWLLLRAKSTSGAGVLARTASVQRLQTVGGKPPAGGCSEARAGAEARVPYSAMYYFYASNEPSSGGGAY